MQLCLAPTLRSVRGLARLVLWWWVLSIGVAAASPLVHSPATELICSGAGGTRLLVQSDEGDRDLRSPTLDCSLCIPVGPSAYVPEWAHAVLRPLGHGPHLREAAHIAARTAAPLPPRGPPAEWLLSTI
jgi:hypothetical protein